MNSSKDGIFYLKIHKIKEYTLKCFQKWIDIANKYNAKVYIVCDDEETKKELHNKIEFHNLDFEIMGSRLDILKPYADASSNRTWYNTTLAKLAIFHHAKEHGYKHFWKIDADDTMILLEDEKIADLLKNAEKIAQEQNIKAFSLDMHTSKLHGLHWSFGICYIDNTIDWFTLFEKHMHDNEYEKNIKYNWMKNLDWFFTYLRNINAENIKTFYVDNMYFIHFGDEHWSRKLSHWTNNKLIYPYLKSYEQAGLCLEAIPNEKEILSASNIYQETMLSEHDIYHEIIKIGSVDENDGIQEIKNDSFLKSKYNFFFNKITVKMLFPPQGLGDILFICALLKEYKKSNPNENIVLLTMKKHFYNLVKLYPDEICTAMSCDEYPPASPLIKFLDKEIYENKTFYDLCENNKTFKSLFTKALNIREDAELYYPPIEEVKEEAFSKTILIAPDAVSCFNVMNDDMWYVLAYMLQAKGYDVIFNCDDESRFAGFPKVFWDMKTTIQMANNMKAVISYRSGLSVVIGAFCRHTPQYVIYPSKNIHNAGNFESEEAGVKAYFDFCSIKKAFNNDLVHEYIFNDNIIETIISEIGDC